jgi:hypothetical protein
MADVLLTNSRRRHSFLAGLSGTMRGQVSSDIRLGVLYGEAAESLRQKDKSAVI